MEHRRNSTGSVFRHFTVFLCLSLVILPIFDMILSDAPS